MNNCCKLELHKAMTKYKDIAMTQGMARGLVESFWNSQFDKGACAYKCGDQSKLFEAHDRSCPFVTVWNGEEMTYLRYSLGIEHTPKVRQ